MAEEMVLSFLRFCLERLPADDRSWPRLYDEMCAVARRQLFHNLDYVGLAERGVVLGLQNVSALRQQAAHLDVPYFRAAHPESR